MPETAWPDLTDKLQLGNKQLGLDISPRQQQLMLQYLQMLHKWNRRFNLTAITDPQQMLILHVLDSLSVLPYIRGPRVLDVGSGAGLPGIILAIARPELQFSCIDSRGKKVRFMQQVVAALQLRNVFPRQQRVESWRTEEPFDTIISRAFASLAEMLRLTAALARDDGQWLAMKGAIDGSEIEQIDVADYDIQATHSLTVPFLQAERHLVMLTRT